jgi:accessory gene regulator protein AgrB
MLYLVITNENEELSNGSVRISPIFQVKLFNFFSFCIRFACSIIVGVISIPVTCETNFASSHATIPGPHATSNTVSIFCGFDYSIIKSKPYWSECSDS